MSVDNLIKSNGSAFGSTSQKKSQKSRHNISATLPGSLKIMEMLKEIGFEWNEDNKEHTDNNEEEGKTKNQNKNKLKNESEPVEERKVLEKKEKEKESRPAVNNNLKLRVMTGMYRGHIDAVRTLCYYPSKCMLFSGSDDGLLKVWNCDGGPSQDVTNSQITLRAHRGIITSMCVLPYHNIWITAGQTGAVIGWNVETIQSKMNSKSVVSMNALNEYESFHLTDHTDCVWKLMPHPSISQPKFASLGADNVIRFYDATRPECSQLMYWTNDDQLSTGQWRDEHSIIVGSNQGQIGRFDLRTGNVVQMLTAEHYKSPHKAVYCMEAKSADILCCGHEDATISVFDTKLGKCVKEWKCHEDAVTSMVWNESTQCLITCSHDCRVRAWDTVYRCVDEIEPQRTHLSKWDEGILCLAMDKQTSMIASSGADGNIVLYKMGNL